MRSLGKKLAIVAIAILVPGGSLLALYSLWKLKQKGALDITFKAPFFHFTVSPKTNSTSDVKSSK